MSAKEFKTGFVGIVGPTNSGKSTLMNALIGQKVSIVSPRAQTTYHSVRGIRNSKDSQIIFNDTPGYQSFPSVIPKLLNKVADRYSEDCELLLWVFDSSRETCFAQIKKLSDKIRKAKTQEKSICILNKVDKIPRSNVLPLMAVIAETELFSEVIPVSALKQENLDRLLKVVEARLNPGEKLYDADSITDRPMSFLAAEMVREQVYLATREELPYSVWVEIEQWKNPEGQEKFPTIHGVLHVDTDSRKGILIGKGGAMLKRIGTQARAEIERLTGHKVVLKLHVDVESHWTENKSRIQQYLEI